MTDATSTTTDGTTDTKEEDDVLERLLNKIEKLQDDAHRMRIVHLVVAVAVALCVVAQFGVMKPLIGVGVVVIIGLAIGFIRRIKDWRRDPRWTKPLFNEWIAGPHAPDHIKESKDKNEQLLAYDAWLKKTPIEKLPKLR